MTKKMIAVFVLLNLLGGCMTYNGAMLPKVENAKPRSLPVIELKNGAFTQALNGVGTEEGLFANSTVASQTGEWITEDWKAKRFIAAAGRAGKLKNPPAYTLTVAGKLDQQVSGKGSTATLLTLFLYPSSSVVFYDLNLTLKDNKTEKEYKVNAKDSVTIRQELFFILAFPFTVVGARRMQKEIAAYAYSEFKKQGAFQ